MKTFVFTLIPGTEVCEKIWVIKQNAHKILGDQLYLLHPPHITLYLGVFDESFLENISDFVKNNLEDFRNVKLSTSGVFSYPKDPITGLVTVYLRVEENNMLHNIQQKLYHALVPYKKREVPSLYVEVWKNLSIETQEKILEQGYAFMGNIWKPHLSIASFEENVWKEGERLAKEQNISGSLYLSTFCIYELTKSKEMIKVKEFKIA
jgi:hypothetical protein